MAMSHLNLDLQRVAHEKISGRHPENETTTLLPPPTRQARARLKTAGLRGERASAKPSAGATRRANQGLRPGPCCWATKKPEYWPLDRTWSRMRESTCSAGSLPMHDD